MAWRKDGEIPRKQRIHLIVDTEANPEVAKMIYAIPYGEINRTVIHLLEKAIQVGGGAGTAPPQTKGSRANQKSASLSQQGVAYINNLNQPASIPDEESTGGKPQQVVSAEQDPDIDPDTARLILEMNN